MERRRDCTDFIFKPALLSQFLSKEEKLHRKVERLHRALFLRANGLKTMLEEGGFVRILTNRGLFSCLIFRNCFVIGAKEEKLHRKEERLHSEKSAIFGLLVLGWHLFLNLPWFFTGFL